MQHDFKNWNRKIQWVDPDAHAAATDIATLDSVIDTKGWRYATITVAIGDSAGVWPIQVTSSATSGGSYTAVTGGLFSVGLTDDNTRMIGTIDLQGDAANLLRFLALSGSEDGTGAIDLGVEIMLSGPISSVELIDYSSGGADELTFDV